MKRKIPVITFCSRRIAKIEPNLISIKKVGRVILRNCKIPNVAKYKFCNLLMTLEIFPSEL